MPIRFNAKTRGEDEISRAKHHGKYGKTRSKNSRKKSARHVRVSPLIKKVTPKKRFLKN